MMHDDELLSELAMAAQAERAADPDARWEALAEGQLHAEALAELEALAAHDPEAEVAMAAFTPLGADAKDRFARAILSELAAEVATEPVGAKVIPFRRRPLFWGLPLAAAAAVALMVYSPSATPEFTPYRLDASAGEQQLRTANAAPTAALPRYRDGSGVELVLRPETRVEATVGVRAFLGQGGAIDPWSPPIESAPGGAFRIHGTAGALLPGIRGEVELLFAVGPEAALPEGDGVRAALTEAPRGWRLLRYRLLRE